MPRPILMRLPNVYFNNPDLPLLSDLQSGLFAEYLFNTGAGNVLVDNSGNGHNLALSGAPVWTAEGISYNATNNGVATGVGIPDDEFTMFVVCEVDSLANQGPVSPMGYKVYVAPDWVGFQFGCNINTASWQLSAMGWSAGTCYLNIPAAQQNKHFVLMAFTYKKSITQSIFHVPSIGFPYVINTPVMKTQAGVVNYKIGMNNDVYFKNKIAYAAVYTKALTEAQVLYENQRLTTLLAARGVVLTQAYTL